MWIQKIWTKLDDEVKEKFDGNWDEAAFDEALTIVIMYGAHEMLLHKAPREHHPHINAAWYGSWIPGHPLHPLRNLVQDKLREFGHTIYDPDNNRLHRNLAHFGNEVHGKITELVRDRDISHQSSRRDKSEWVDGTMEQMSDYLDDSMPRRR